MNIYQFKTQAQDRFGSYRYLAALRLQAKHGTHSAGNVLESLRSSHSHVRYFGMHATLLRKKLAGKVKIRKLDELAVEEAVKRFKEQKKRK